MTDLSESGYLIHLLSSVINGFEPQEIPSDTDTEKLYAAAKSHTVANIACYGLERLKNKPDPESMKKWKQFRDKAVRIDIFQQMEFERICASFKENGIRFLPLKGIIIKGMYPQSDMRAMSDIDILIDPVNAPAVKEIMTALGFEVKAYGEADDAYQKNTVYVEIHKSLFESYFKGFSEIFSDPWKNAVSEDGYFYKFTNDYFFVYMLAHALKHFKLGGTGIRSFMDIYIFQKTCGDTLDMSVMEKMLDKESLALCRDFIRLSQIWFGNGRDDGGLDEMKKYVLSGGTYGSFSTGIENEIKQKGRARYLLDELFPCCDRMIYTFPVLKKAPYLMPLCWIARPFVKIFTSPKKVCAKVKGFLGLKNKD